MPASIFAGSKVKTLKGTLSLNGGADVISSATDPTSVAVDASPGSILLNTTSGKQYRKNDSGSSTNWTEVGSGVSGINYITNPSASTNTTGWATYADAAGTQPVDGTSGSPTVTWTRSTTTPLRGAADFNFTKTAANSQGQGVSTDITIDLADQAKVLTVSFDYEVVSGTYADGDLTVYLIADPAGTPIVIQPAGYVIQSAVAGTKMRQIATFQTQATGQSYRVCFHVASTSASAYVVAVDNVVVGPQVVQYGAPVTDWVAYTPTFTGFGTVATQTFWSRRVGDSVEIKGRFTAGTTTATEARITLPSGLTSDSSKVNGTLELVGKLDVNRSATTFFGSGTVLVEPSVNYLTFGLEASTVNGLSKQNGNTVLGTGEVASFYAKVPVLGWSSTVQMSNDTDTRVVAMRAGGTPTGTLNTSYNTTVFGTTSYDTHGSYNSSTGVYTIPVSGYYRVTSNIGITGTGGTYALSQIYVNGVGSGVAGGPGASSGTRNIFFVGTVQCNAGDQVTLRSSTDSVTPSYSASLISSSLMIERLSGPATIAASETVGCTFNTLTANTVTAAGIDLIYTNKVFDTHGAYNTSSGEYSVPVSGEYTISGQYRSATTAMTVGFGTTIYIRVDGTLVNYLALVRTQTASGIIREVSGAPVTLRLNAGQKIKFGASSDTNTALDTSTSGIQTQFNWMSIMRTGN